MPGPEPKCFRALPLREMPQFLVTELRQLLGVLDISSIHAQHVAGCRNLPTDGLQVLLPDLAARLLPRFWTS